MRITGGKARSIILNTPKGDITRPATDYMREAVFSYLSDFVVDKNVLDIFAGTGSYGLESISRGAKSVNFVEKDKKVIDVLKKNISSVSKSTNQSQDSFNIISFDAFKFITNNDLSFYDIIFADMPYHLLEEKGSFVIQTCLEKMNKEALLAFECPANFTLPNFLEQYLEKSIAQRKKDQPCVKIFSK